MQGENLPPGVGRRIDFFEAPANLVFLGTSAFLLGVLSSSAGWNIFAILLLSSIAGLALVFVKKAPLGAALILFLAVFLGAFYYHLYLNIRESRTHVVFNESLHFSGDIVTEPRFTEKTQYFLLKLQPPLAGKIKIVTPQIPEFSYGDRLEVRGKIQESSGIDPPFTLFPEIELRGSGHGFPLKSELLGFKARLIAEFRRALPRDSAALLAGLTFGARSDFSRELKDDMALSGTTHLVALSGYNIAILVLVTAGIFNYFFSRRLTFYLTAATIVLFVLMVGAEASVVRAAVMGFLVLFAKEVGRLYSFRNAITLAAGVMALFDPTILVFDLGFQLSFLSLLGIVYLAPAIDKFLERFSKRRPRDAKQSFLGWRENAVTTLSAQLAVAPLLIQNFGQVSATSLLANILILEFVPLTMALGFILATVSLLLSHLGILFAWLVNVLLAYEIWVIKFFADLRLPLGSVSSGFVFLVYYAFIIGFMMYLRQPPRLHDEKA